MFGNFGQFRIRNLRDRNFKQPQIFYKLTPDELKNNPNYGKVVQDLGLSLSALLTLVEKDENNQLKDFVAFKSKRDRTSPVNDHSAKKLKIAEREVSQVSKNINNKLPPPHQNQPSSKARPPRNKSKSDHVETITVCDETIIESISVEKLT